ncbi:MAG: methyltransferase type 11 [uncultured bacterium]|nr:MAG: methyltransferase type 11 [uncultured bacterium]
MSLEKDYYENEIFWSLSNLQGLELERISKSYKLIPDDAGSVLDAGCGNGVFLNYILSKAPRQKFTNLIGVDTCKTALKYVNTKKINASITKLPFPDKSYDLVSALEVVEHLNVQDLGMALQELARTSNKYILISVPYCQILEDGFVQCPQCKSKFNLVHHKRSFDKETITTLFDKFGYHCTKLELVGIQKELALLMPIYRLYKKINPPPIRINTPCPVCSNHILAPEEHKGNAASNPYRKIATVSKILWKFWPTISSYRWVICLYEKN